MKTLKPSKAPVLFAMAAAAFLAAAACGGGGDEATQTPSATATAVKTAMPMATPAATRTAAPTSPPAITVGKLAITGVSSRVVLDNGAVYMTISNSGDTPDALVKASASIAGTTELHQTVTEGNTTRMEPVERIEIPAGGQVVLKKGGLHVMMMKVQPGIKVGDKFSLSLTFEKAGSVTLEVTVAEIAESGDGMGGMATPGAGMDSGMGAGATPAMPMR